MPNWENEFIKKVSAIPSIHLVKITLMGKRRDSAGLSYQLYSLMDHAILPGKPTALSKMKATFPTQSSTLKLTIYGNDYDRQELDKIKESNLDIIIHFGHTTLKKSILSISRLGTWSILFGHNKLPYYYAGFWEWFYKEPVNSVAIVHQKEDQDQIYRVTIAQADTQIDPLSLNRNQTLIFSKAIDLVISSLNRILMDRDFILIENKHKAPFRKEPSFWYLVAAFLKLIIRLTKKTFTKIFYIDQWVLFSSPHPNFPTFNFDEFNPIIPPKDRFWADPFVISQDNKHFIFIEEFLYKNKKGHLNCIVLDSQGKMEDSKIILEKPYHLSYPFIFKYHDKWFLVPESAENKTVDLYECIEFPFKWELKRNLLEGFSAYDSTLHFVNDRIWLFCTIQQSEEGSPNDDLHLFSTNNLLEGKWTPHPKNPVVSDPYTARPAGKIFNHKGMWYRPSQVCIPRYGYALSINRIDQLDEKFYHETTITQNTPNWHKQLISNHTYNSSNQLTITDGQLKRFKFYS